MDIVDVLRQNTSDHEPNHYAQRRKGLIYAYPSRLDILRGKLHDPNGDESYEKSL